MLWWLVNAFAKLSQQINPSTFQQAPEVNWWFFDWGPERECGIWMVPPCLQRGEAQRSLSSLRTWGLWIGCWKELSRQESEVMMTSTKTTYMEWFRPQENPEPAVFWVRNVLLPFIAYLVLWVILHIRPFYRRINWSSERLRFSWHLPVLSSRHMLACF